MGFSRRQHRVQLRFGFASACATVRAAQRDADRAAGRSGERRRAAAAAIAGGSCALGELRRVHGRLSGRSGVQGRIRRDRLAARRPAESVGVAVRRVQALLLLVALAVSGCARETPYEWHLPPGFPKPRVPEDNALTVEKADLGRHLFYDKRLSGNGTQACASCHQQAHAFAEPSPVATGSTGQKHHRNSMALANEAYTATFTWAHSGIDRIEQQVLLPLFGDKPVEMGAAGREDEILARLRKDPEYQKLFSRAFPAASDPVTFDNAVKALASFVRTLISFDSPFDRYAYYGDDKALTESQVRGMNLFMS